MSLRKFWRLKKHYFHLSISFLAIVLVHSIVSLFIAVGLPDFNHCFILNRKWNILSKCVCAC